MSPPQPKFLDPPLYSAMYGRKGPVLIKEKNSFYLMCFIFLVIVVFVNRPTPTLDLFLLGQTAAGFLAPVQQRDSISQAWVLSPCTQIIQFYTYSEQTHSPCEDLTVIGVIL